MKGEIGSKYVKQYKMETKASVLRRIECVIGNERESLILYYKQTYCYYALED